MLRLQRHITLLHLDVAADGAGLRDVYLGPIGDRCFLFDLLALSPRHRWQPGLCLYAAKVLIVLLLHALQYFSQIDEWI
jgi:hypothetical protein